MTENFIIPEPEADTISLRSQGIPHTPAQNIGYSSSSVSQAESNRDSPSATSTADYSTAFHSYSYSHPTPQAWYPPSNQKILLLSYNS
jgi:hypothetical protein